MRRPALPSDMRPPGEGPFLVHPECGFWMMRARRNGPEVPASIGQIDHEPGDPENKLDTGPVFIASIGLRDVDPFDVWWRSKRPISEAEFRYQMARLTWARDYDPSQPELNPRRAVDLGALPPIGPSE